jgi:glc operon protein GlcG
MKALIFALIITVLGSLAAGAQTTDKKALTLEGARRVIAGAREFARKANAPGVVVAVVDDGGNLVALERLDGTFNAGASISIGKARTAAMFKRPTKFFEDVIKNGRTAMVALPDFTPLQGGVPIIVDGQLVGAVGVSGAASAQQDEEMAMAGAAALASATRTVSFYDAQAVADAFGKGAVVFDGANGENFMIHASRRDKPGLAEIHELDTDVIYVLDGTAVFVTGGRAVDTKQTAPDEFRGTSIDGGELRDLKKGDIVVVPKGTPHWFKEVGGTLLYYVVKVR